MSTATRRTPKGEKLRYAELPEDSNNDESFEVVFGEEEKIAAVVEDDAENGTVPQQFDEEELIDPTKHNEEVIQPTASSDGSSESFDKEGPVQKTRCRDHKRVKELYTSADYWSLWIGLATFGMALILVFAVPYSQDDSTTRVKYVVPQPMPWTTNPFDAWDVYGLVGTFLLLAVLCSMYLLSCKLMGKLQKKQPDETGSRTLKYILGFAVMAVLATLSFWIGRNEWCSDHGLGYAVFAIIFGMVVTNVPGGSYLMDHWLGLAAKDGEFFIKCSLVLLAVQLDTLLSVGAPGIVVAWVGSPLAIVLGYIIGTRLMKCEDRLAIIIAVGASWCGASAISAVAPVVQASSEQVSLAISVVAFFTLGFTFLQPYIALGVGMPDDVAGAWIGASVDQTGNVIVSAAIVSDEATEVAGIVKMVLNSALGVLASVIACWWSSRRREGDDEENRQPKFSLIMLWDKFPKFTIGFLITSVILTGTMQRIGDTAEGDALPSAISSLNKWWFAIAFVGIGLTTNIRKLWDGAIKSGIIQVYLITNAIDIFLALGLAYLLF